MLFAQDTHTIMYAIVSTTANLPRLQPKATIHDLPNEIWLLMAACLTSSEKSQLVLRSHFFRERFFFHEITDLLDFWTLPEHYRDYNWKDDGDRWDLQNQSNLRVLHNDLQNLVGEWRERRMREGFPKSYPYWCAFRKGLILTPWHVHWPPAYGLRGSYELPGSPGIKRYCSLNWWLHEKVSDINFSTACGEYKALYRVPRFGEWRRYFGEWEPMFWSWP